MSSDSGDRSRADRRRFLAGLTGYCAASLAVGAARASEPSEPEASAILPSGRRSLSFLHTHTGERLEVDYFQDGTYQPECLAQVNHLLRDFRTDEVHPIDPALLDILASLQVLVQRTGVFEVISGYRSPATNALLRRTTEGVAQHSMHLVGRAIDVRLEKVSTAELARCARSLRLGGVGFYPTSDFVHVDTGRVRSW